MGLIICLLAALAASAVGADTAGADWTRIWRLCQEAPKDSAAPAELSVLLADAPSGLKKDVARYHLGAVGGEDPALVPCESMPALEPGGAWAFSIALQPGPFLDAALVLALDEEGGLSDLQPVLERGYERFLLHSEAAAASESLILAEALHRRAGAVWSGMNLGISRSRSGDYEGAVEVLEGLLSGELQGDERATITSRVSLVHLGAGGILQAREALGAGLVVGSGDSRIVLGLLALERGRWSRSRALFRSSLSRDPRQAWAGRGWGLSMVPRPEMLTKQSPH